MIDNTQNKNSNNTLPKDDKTFETLARKVSPEENMVIPPNKTVLQNNNKKNNKKWLLWGLVGFTGILLITAVVLFIQLKKPVEPEGSFKPKTSPKIPEVKQVEGEGVCEVNFTVDESDEPTASCTKEALKDGDNVSSLNPGDTFSYKISYKSNDLDSITVSDEIDSNLTYLSSSIDSCEYDSDTRIVICDIDTSTNANGDVIFNLEIDSDIENDITIPNECDLISDSEEMGSCGVDVDVEVIPDDELACFDTCSNDDECSGNYRCMDYEGVDRCLNPDCPEETDCDCPGELKACFDTCSNDDECSGSYRCMVYPGTTDLRCLNADCSDEVDCSCPISQASPSPTPSISPSPRIAQPELPPAGGNTALVLGVSSGVLLILLGLLF